MGADGVHDALSDVDSVCHELCEEQEGQYRALEAGQYEEGLKCVEGAAAVAIVQWQRDVVAGDREWIDVSSAAGWNARTVSGQ